MNKNKIVKIVKEEIRKTIQENDKKEFLDRTIREHEATQEHRTYRRMKKLKMLRERLGKTKEGVEFGRDLPRGLSYEEYFNALALYVSKKVFVPDEAPYTVIENVVDDEFFRKHDNFLYRLSSSIVS